MIRRRNGARNECNTEINMINFSMLTDTTVVDAVGSQPVPLNPHLYTPKHTHCYTCGSLNMGFVLASGIAQKSQRVHVPRNSPPQGGVVELPSFLSPP